jgi:protein-arginine kinase activator protein McsA
MLDQVLSRGEWQIVSSEQRKQRCSLSAVCIAQFAFSAIFGCANEYRNLNAHIRV